MPKSSAHKRKSKKNTSLIGFVVFTLSLVSLLFLGAYFVYKSLSLSAASALSINSFDLINSNSYTILLADSDSTSKIESISLVLIDKKGKKVKIYKFPGNLVINAHGRFGNEEVSKLLMLGSLEGAKETELTKQTIQDFLGINVDRYIYIGQDIKQPVYELFTKGDGSGLMSLESLRTISRSLKTDMKVNELYVVYKYITGLPSDRFFTYNLSQSDVDNSTSLDEDIRDMTLNSDFAAEKKSVAVLNGTDVSGMAGIASRFVENMGGRVVALGNASKQYQESILVVDDKQSLTAQSIKRYFGISKVITKNDAKDIYEGEIDRADISIIIGFDIANEFK